MLDIFFFKHNRLIQFGIWLFLLFQTSLALAVGKFEAGTIALNATPLDSGFKAITFQQTYDEVPVVVVMPSAEGVQPRSVRIKNITVSGFDVVVAEPTGSNLIDVPMTVNYAAMEPGVVVLPDGHEIEAGFISTDNYQTGFGLGGASWSTLNFDASFSSTPALVTQLQTMNNETGTVSQDASVPWMTVAQRSVTAAGASLALERAEVNDGDINTDEVIGFIALESGAQGSFTDVLGNAVEYEGIYSSDSIRGWRNCASFNFVKNYTSPIAVASQTTRDGSNGGWLRACSMSTGSASFTIDEDQDRDTERNHTTERAGIIVFSDSFYASLKVVEVSKSSGGKLEAGSFSLPAGATSWTSVNFQQTYSSVPYVFTLATNDGSEPAAIRVKDITTTGFQAGVFEPTGSDGLTELMAVDYIAIEDGEHVLGDGSLLDAGSVITNAIQHGSGVSGAESYSTVNFNTAFASPPAFIGQIQSNNNEAGATPGTVSTPWLTTAVTSLTNSSVRLALERSESGSGSVVSMETIAYLAAEQQEGTFTDSGANSIGFDFKQTADVIRGWSNGCYDHSFTQNFATTPLVVATKSRHDGGDGGWIRRCSISSSSVGFAVDEDTSRDNERAHTTEAVGVLAFSESFYVDLDISDLVGCAASFPDGVSSHDAAGSASFGKDAYVSDSPDNKLDLNDLDKNNGSTRLTCEHVDCAVSNTNVDVINPGSFIETNSALTFDTDVNFADLGADTNVEYGTVTASQGDTLSFSNTQNKFLINELNLEKDVTVNLVAGDYWIETLNIDKDVTLTVSGTGTARIFVNNAVSATQGLSANTGVASGNASQLVLYGYNNLSFGNDTQFTGFIYSAGSASFGNSNTIVGAVTAENISLGKDSHVTYGTESGDLAKEVDFGDMCDADAEAAFFKVIHDGYGINCSREVITIEVYDANSEIVESYNKSITLDTGTGYGTWYVQGENTALNNDGVATYSFTGAENGIVTFELDYQEVGAVNITVWESLDATTKDDDTEAELHFTPQGFLITSSQYVEGGSDTYSDQTSAVESDLYITAYGDTGVDGCGIIESYQGNKDLKIWFDYDDPVTGSISPTLEASALAASQGAATNSSFSFSSGQIGPYRFKYNDVGRIQINALDETSVSDVQIAGSSSAFVVKPADFVISNVRTLDSVSNPAAVNDSGGVFAKAGESFLLTVTAVNAEGNATPNYGNEVSSESVQLSGTLVAPSTGVDPGLTGGVNLVPSGNAGEFMVDSGNPLIWDEVGILGIQASVGGPYLGTENITGTQIYVGRFIPAYFDVNLNTVDLLNNTTTRSCGFSYQDSSINFGSDLEVTVTARTESGDKADNYFDGGSGNNFWKLGNGLQRNYTDANGNGSAVSVNSGSVSLTGNNSPGGEGVFRIENDSLVYNRSLQPESTDTIFESVIELNVSQSSITDSDGVCYDQDADDVCDDFLSAGIQGAIDPVMVHYGRVILNNAVGSELLPLQLNAIAQSWQGTGFATNTLDSCTSPVSADIQVSFPSGSALSNGDTSLSSWQPFTAGMARVDLSAPGANKTGFAEIVLELSASFPWLQYDFGAGALTQNPSARASFGLYQGNDPVIFRREITR